MLHKWKKVVGLAVTERGITAVEVGMAAGRRSVLRSAALPFSAELNPSDPERLGKELKRTLREAGVRTSRCVIGLAANWIAAREKTLPATDANSVRGALTIAAERDFASGTEGLLFDYSAWTTDAGISALVLAAQRQIVEQMTAAAKAAGLSVAAVTSSTAALALATQGAIPKGGRIVLCLLPHGVELAAQSAAGVHLIRHLPVRLDQPTGAEGLSAELQRTLLLSPASQVNLADCEVLVWNSAEVDERTLDAVEHHLGAAVKMCRLGRDIALADAPAGPKGDVLAQAAACGVDRPAIDFVHSRLAAPTTGRRERRIRWAAAAAAVVLAGIGYLLFDWNASRMAVAALQKESKAMEPSAQEAKTLVDNVSFARGWYDQRPESLNIFREITEAFPEQGSIWVTSMSVDEVQEESKVPHPGKAAKAVEPPKEIHVMLSGKAVDEAAVQGVMEKLKSNPKLKDVTPRSIGHGEGSSRDVFFMIELNARRNE